MVAKQCPDTLEDPVVQTVQVVRMIGTSVFTVLIWDWIITLQREIDLFWKTKWTVIKALFLFLRYWTLLLFPVVLAIWDGNFTFETCQAIHRLEPGLCMPIIWAAEGILLARTYTLYEKNKVVLAVGIVGLLGVVVGQLITVFTVVALPFPPHVQEFACVATGRPGGEKLLLGFWIAPFLFDTLITGLTVARALTFRRSGNTILKTFITQGILYFVLIAAVNLINVVLFVQSDQALQPVNALLAILATSLFAQRMVLQLRSAGIAVGTSNAIPSGGEQQEYTSSSEKTAASFAAAVPAKLWAKPGKSSSEGMSTVASTPRSSWQRELDGIANGKLPQYPLGLDRRHQATASGLPSPVETLVAPSLNHEGSAGTTPRSSFTSSRDIEAGSGGGGVLGYNATAPNANAFPAGGRGAAFKPGSRHLEEV